MERRRFGGASFDVPALGLGGGAIGDPSLDDRDVARLLDVAVEVGAALIDTAPSYGASEERIGRWLAQGARDRVVVATKLGYGVPGVPDWTGACIERGVDLALARLRTDRLDVALLHSCPREVLARGDVVEALSAATLRGKVRVAGYSGDDGALAFAMETGAFGAFETSVSPWDQRSLGAIRSLDGRAGVFAKRPLANAPWRFAERPSQHDLGVYWDRFRALALEPGDLAWDELALRFAAFAPGVSTALVGTKSEAHLRRAADAVAKGPLPADTDAAIRTAFERAGGGWGGIV